MDTSRVVLCVDLDYFYAQCEEREDSSLKSKPVVVCVYSGRTSDSGAVSTANYLARSLGVKSGIPIAFAKRILKDRHDAVFLPVNEQLYQSVSNSIMNILRKFADKFEQRSIDEAFLDISDRVQGDFEKAKEQAVELKSQVYSKERITSSVGVGPNKLVAKMACDFQKPDGLTVILPEDVTKFLWPLKIGKLYGVGTKTEKKMNEMGIERVGDLAKFDVKLLTNTFGPNLGLYFRNAANGIDDEPVEEREGREQISRIATLKQNTRDTEKIIPDIEKLAEEVHEEVKSENWRFRSVGILAFMEDLTVHSRSRTLDSPTNDLNLIRSTAAELLQELLDRVPQLDVRRIGVKVTGLSRPAGQTFLTEFSPTS